ncbi:SDR family oxidoreductase [Natranaeroarchaeum sulfidigenes]|uniref:Short-chain alcohol dehydrogenase n=1 Tax=Natranaeroarchaeum sulfidigenes TaxID=2784880 RepID=A0A897MTG6_9EURY|nr:SDR family oxidoreductase [Natranaeroarchaeum sulfidigenes]QSG03777.1 Short-chain alcohol dehydrogenase [Natranaeroarchaeum sulfidigenes]
MADTQDDETGETPPREGKLKTVLITGCSSGIGREAAKAFLDDDGWTVYATARDTDDIADLGEAGCETAELDVTDENHVRQVVERVLSETGRIDALINNAGYGQMGPIEEVPTEVVHEQFDVNVYGPHRLIRAVLPHMRERERGTIVNVSSVGGRVSHPGGGVYCGSKFALEAMSDALRSEVEPFDIDVALVEPGPVNTSFGDEMRARTDKLERSGAYDWFYSVIEDTQLIGGGGFGSIEAKEVAETILEAANSPNPSPRYPVGQFGKLSSLARLAPDPIRDAVFGIVRRFV